MMERLSKFDADVIGHLQGEGRHGICQTRDDLVDCYPQVGGDFMEPLDDARLIQGVEAAEKLGGVVRLDVPRFQCSYGEVLQIESHDDPAPASNGGGEDVAVFGIVPDAGFDWLESFNAGFRKVPGELLSPVDDEIVRPTEFSRRTVGFIENPVAPIREKQARCLGQAEKQVGHPLVGEHAGIEQNRKVSGHWRRTDRGSIKPGFLGPAREFVECGPPPGVAGPLEIHQVLHEDAPVGSDFVEGDFVGFQKLDQVRPGNPEEIGSGLGSEFLGLRDQRDDLALLQRGGHPDEHFVNRSRQLGAAARFIHQGRWLRLAAEEFHQPGHRFHLLRTEGRWIETGRKTGLALGDHGVSVTHKEAVKRNKRNANIAFAR